MKITLRRVFFGLLGASIIVKLSFSLSSGWRILAAILLFLVAFVECKDLFLLFMGLGTSLIFVSFVGIPAGGSIEDSLTDIILWGLIGTLVGISIGKLALLHDASK
jgi:hypothetical protein